MKAAAAIASLHLRDAVFVLKFTHGPSEYGSCVFFAGRLRVFQLQRRKHCKIGGVTVEAIDYFSSVPELTTDQLTSNK